MSRPLAAIAVAVLGFLAAVPSASGVEKRRVGERRFELGKDGREQVVFPVAGRATVIVRAVVKKPLASTPVRLLLEGPGGLRVEKTGSAPLRLRYRVEKPEEEGSWRAVVVNVARAGRLTGKLSVDLESGAPPSSAPKAGKRAPAAVTDGAVSRADDPRLRVVCRDDNRDVSLRLDLESGSGRLYLRDNHVFDLEVRALSEGVVELRGGGEHPLYLDLGKGVLYFASGERGAFCRVRVYRGDDG